MARLVYHGVTLEPRRREDHRNQRRGSVENHRSRIVENWPAPVLDFTLLVLLSPESDSAAAECFH